YPLIHRDNNFESFNMSITDSTVDKIIVLLCTTSWLGLSLVGRIRTILMPVYGLASIFSLLAHQDFILNSLVLISVPIIASLILIKQVLHRKISRSLTILPLNYIAMFGLVTSIISIFLTIGITSSISSQTRDFAYGIFLLFSSICPIMI